MKLLACIKIAVNFSEGTERETGRQTERGEKNLAAAAAAGVKKRVRPTTETCRTEVKHF